MGDFNINTMHELSCTLAQEQEFINLFSTLHYHKLINLPTRITNLSIRRGRLCETSHVGIGHLGTLVYHSFRFRGIRLFNAISKQIRDLSCSVSSFKYQLDKYLSTIPDTPCIANYDNSLENSSHTNPHLLTGVHPV